MNRRIAFPILALASFLFTGLFYAEYLPPLRRVDIPYDLGAYHYPLTDFAFRAVSHGRFPEWDPAIYSGISFVGNPQAALFYPFTWLLFAVDLGHPTLPFLSLEIFVLLHVWIAFLICYIWLRGRNLADLACILGAGVFAFSGYLCLQLQHLGLVVAFAWFPLGMMGIDEAAESGKWRPLWKLAAASALCFLAGYPPMWIVFAVSMFTYAVARPWRTVTVVGTALALGFSLLLASIQLVPSWEMTSLMLRMDRYGAGIREPAFFLSYFIPNYFDFGRNVPVQTNFKKEYLYLGAPAFFGIGYLLRGRSISRVIPSLAVGLVTLIFVTNPFNLVWEVLHHWSLLGELFRAWYFLAGLTLASVSLAAYGLDDFLKQSTRLKMPRSSVFVVILAMAAWCGWELIQWARDSFAHGPKGIYDPLITLGLFAAAIWIFRSRPSGALGFALILAVGIDYKAFGTSKRFNSTAMNQVVFTPTSFPAMDPFAFEQLRTHRDYRILIDETSPSPMELRRADLSTPQGFDPFITRPYTALIESVGAQFRSERVFDLDPANHAMLALFGIRYVIVSAESRFFEELKRGPIFREIGSTNNYFHVFEVQNALPPYGFEQASAGQVTMQRWLPDDREVSVHSDSGGRFVLHEQRLAGWTATVDGQAVTSEPWRDAFQAVQVPPGDHVIRFRFRSMGLRIGGGISFLSLIALVWFSRFRY